MTVEQMIQEPLQMMQGAVFIGIPEVMLIIAVTAVIVLIITFRSRKR